MKAVYRLGVPTMILTTLVVVIGCQPLTHEVSVPAHGQGGATSVRKYTPRALDKPLAAPPPSAPPPAAPPPAAPSPASVPPEGVKGQEGKQTRLEELEAKVKQLELENAELKKSATGPTP